jgi:hypothetical protein
MHSAFWPNLYFALNKNKNKNKRSFKYMLQNG